MSRSRSFTEARFNLLLPPHRSNINHPSDGKVNTSPTSFLSWLCQVISQAEGALDDGREGSGEGGGD